ncbi:MAG: hypothetical protein JWL62_3328, partial [Hyphomicrobiales bacterium]|nr:hypothetical protein [Hyphomicrobiales bacterium]
DVGQITTSTEKIVRRGDKIEQLEFTEGAARPALEQAAE